MPTTDPRLDAYIARQADFARPILEHLRSAVHSACPEAEETLKWSMPHFLYKGQMLAGMAAFKAHATFGFWRAKEVVGETGAEREAMGQFGRLASVADLPPEDVLRDLIGKAMALTDAGVRPARAKAAPKAEPQTPPELELGARMPTPPRAPRSTAFRPAAGANMPSGWPGRSGPRPATSASPRRSNGWPRARGGTGNTRNADRAPFTRAAIQARSNIT